MAEFEELRITVNLVDNASQGLAGLRAQLGQLQQFSHASAASLNAMTTSLTQTGQAATAASRGLQQVTQQTNAAGRAATSLNRDMIALNRATTDLTRGFQSLAVASQRDLGAALPLLATGISSLATGMTGLTSSLGLASTAARVAAIGIGGIGIALLAGVAAYGAYQVSVFNFAKEMKGLSDTARQMGVSFADLRHATVAMRAFGLGQEAVIQSFAGMQRAMTNLYQNQSQLRQKLISEGLDPGWLRAWENENDEVERLAQAQQKMIDIRNEHLRRGATLGQATGIMRSFAQDIGVDPRLADKPLIPRLGTREREEYERVARESKLIMERWDRISDKITGLKEKLFTLGLPGVERSMERLEGWLNSITDKDVEEFFRKISDYAEKFANSLVTAGNVLSGNVFKKGTVGGFLFPGLTPNTPEEAEAARTRDKAGGWGGSILNYDPRKLKPLGSGDSIGGIGGGAVPFMGQPTPGTAGAPRFDSGLTGNWGNVPLSDNVIDLRKRDEQGELVEENTDVLSETNELLKSLNQYLDELTPGRKPAAGDGTGTPQGLLSGGTGGGGGVGPGGVGGTGGGGGGGGAGPGGPMGPGGGPSNVPGAGGGGGGGGGGAGGATSEALIDAIQKQEGYFPGSRAYRNNNPGNIKFGPFAKAQGATGADDKGHAIFPDYQTGRAALGALLQTPRYAGKSIAEIGKSYAEDPKWAEGVAKQLGVGTDYVPSGEGPGLAGEPGSAAPEAVLAKAREVAAVGGPAAVQAYMRSQGQNVSSAWCGQFAAFVIKKAGGTPPQNPAIASNWRNTPGYDPVTGAPQAGDIAVAKPGWAPHRGTGRTGEAGSHVTFVDKYDPKTGQITGLGGAQGGGMRSQYDARRFDYFRRRDPSTIAAKTPVPAASAQAARPPSTSAAVRPPSMERLREQLSTGPGGRDTGRAAREYNEQQMEELSRLSQDLTGAGAGGVRILDGPQGEGTGLANLPGAAPIIRPDDPGTIPMAPYDPNAKPPGYQPGVRVLDGPSNVANMGSRIADLPWVGNLDTGGEVDADIIEAEIARKRQQFPEQYGALPQSRRLIDQRGGRGWWNTRTRGVIGHLNKDRDRRIPPIPMGLDFDPEQAGRPFPGEELDAGRGELDKSMGVMGETTVKGTVDVNVNAPRGTSVSRKGDLFKRGRHIRSTQMAPTGTGEASSQDINSGLQYD